MTHPAKWMEALVRCRNSRNHSRVSLKEITPANGTLVKYILKKKKKLKPNKNTAREEKHMSAYILCGVIQVFGKLGSPICFKKATLTPCFDYSTVAS